jgi:hypothetical protein
MPRTKTYRSLGVNVTVNVPDNPFAPGEDNHLIFEAGIDNCIYRGGKGLSLFRELFAKAVEDATGVEAETKVALNSKGEPRKDEDGNEIRVFAADESERVEKALAKANRTIESFQELANTISTQIVCDPKIKERGPSEPKTPPKSVYATVDALFTQGQQTQVAAALSTILGRTVEAERESLARAIHEDQLAELRKAKDKWAPKAA